MTVPDVNYSNIESVEGYAVLFGNMERGWHINAIPGQTLQEFWRKAVKFSRSPRVGDVTLFYNGKAIRDVWNFSTLILYNKKIEEARRGGKNKDYHSLYKVVYNKYN